MSNCLYFQYPDNSSSSNFAFLLSSMSVKCLGLVLEGETRQMESLQIGRPGWDIMML